MARKSWNIAGVPFATKGALETHIRAILERYQDGERLNTADENFVHEILKMHRHYDAKTASGLDFIFVRHLAVGRRFEVMRADGTPRDFAWSHCLEQNENLWPPLLRLLRRLIIEQLNDFRAGRYDHGWACELCGELLLLSRDTQVDHLPPWTFRHLVDEWLEYRKLTPETIQIVASRVHQTPSYFADPEHRESWLTFHRGHALLRMLCIPCHLKVTAQNARSRKESVIQTSEPV